MPLLFRDFLLSDHALARALWECTDGVGLSEADGCAETSAFLSRNPGLSFVAIADGMLVGTILCGHDGRRGLIHHLVTAQAWRGRGIGRALLRLGLDALRRAGIDKCHLLVFRTNEAGLSFWRKVGAEERDMLALFSVSTRPANDHAHRALGRMLANGRLTAVPKRPADQEVLLGLAAAAFEPGRVYPEGEVNERLKGWLQVISEPFGIDHVTMRRMLVDARFLVRTQSGSMYQLDEGHLGAIDALRGLDVVAALREVGAARERRKREHAVPPAGGGESGNHSLRPLGPPDATAFQSLRLQGLQECPTAFASSYEEEIGMTMEAVAERLTSTAGHCVLGAFRDAELLGVVAVHREAKRKLAHKAIIWGMYVAPSARRSGVGRTLVARALAAAGSMDGVCQVVLGVNTRNEAAIALYKSLGFVAFGHERAFMQVDGEWHDEFQMVCPLGEAR